MRPREVPTPVQGLHLRRTAAALAFGTVVAACAAPPSGRPPRGEPSLRVGLVTGASEVQIGAQSEVTVSPAGGVAFRLTGDERITIVPVGEGVGLRDRSGGRSYERIRATSSTRSRFVVVNGRPYRGWVDVFARNGQVYAVNELGVEAYLLGVVSTEMGPRPERDRAAVEAQAIVSRTYALKNRGRFRAEGYDLRAGISDQAYRGVDAETQLGRAAVRETAGLVVTYAGELISPFFHSTCGGSTAGPEEAFRTVQPVAYLQPVSDRRPGGGYYCDRSPRFRWEVAWDGPVLQDILRRSIRDVLGVDAAQADGLRHARVHRTGRSGRAVELRIAVGSGEIPVFGPDVRQVFRTPEGQPLGSTALELTATRREGNLERLVARGSGWGHGVGMCQWGAIGRARAGQRARAIVAAYFRGSRIEAWY